MPTPPTAKGRVPFGEYETWYRVTGDPAAAGRPALVTVHGGPGSTHDYLLPLTRLAEHGWPVVHYDQLGNGGSTHLPERVADFWTVQLFLDELENLLRRLDIREYVLFGQSWGGMLAAAHAAARPAGLRGLVIANAPASYVLWREEMKVLRDALPPGVNETLEHLEAAGQTQTDEYFQALVPFYQRHVCRLDPWPREYLASFYEVFNDPTVYYAMNGPSEFHVIGTLKDWSVEDLCPDIAVPTLLVSGRHDEATPRTVQPYADLIPDVRWELFEESSHLPHLEEPERFDEVLLGYLRDLQEP